MKGHYWLIILILAVLTPSGVSAFSELFSQHKFHRLDEAQGLNNSFVNDIAQDSLGQIWVGTEHGVFRYQGVKFQEYIREKNNDQSLPNNYVSDVYVDRQNMVWFMTESGIGRYRYDTDEMERYMPDKIQGAIMSMVMDSRDNKYFGAYGGGIYTVNNDEVVKRLVIDNKKTNDNLSDLSVLHMTIVDDVIWAVLSTRGVVSYDIKSGQSHFYPAKLFGGRDRLRFFTMYVDSSESIWLGTSIGVFKLTQNYKGDYNIYAVASPDLPVDDMLSIYVDDADYVWVGSRQNGVFRFKNSVDFSQDMEVVKFKPSENERGISYRTVSKIFQDGNGLFWLGTHYGGINVFDPKGEKIRYLTYEVNGLNTLNFRNVWGLAEGKDGELWIGTDGRGLNMFDPVTGLVSYPNWPELDNVAVLTALEDHKSRLWVGTYENGLFQIDLKSSELKQFKVGTGNADLKVNDIRCLYQSTLGDLFVGTNQGGVYYFNEKTGRLEFIEATLGYDIRAITMTDDGLLWLATYRGGLMSYNPRSEETTMYPFRAENGQSVVVFDLCPDNGTLWLATREKGFAKFDLITKKFDYGFDGAGLDEMSISGIEKDDLGRLWMTTSMGIYCYDAHDGSVARFDYNDGVQKGHFNYGSLFKSKNGYFAAGGTNGLNLFYPDELLEQETLGNVVFNELKVLNRKVTPINSEMFEDQKSIFETKSIVLSYLDNEFTLSFALPGFNFKKQNEFEYILEGFDSDWREIDYQNEVAYHNVDPGKYTFKVRSLGSSLVSNQIKITVEPPIWRTWQFSLLLVVLICVLLYYFMTFNNSRVALKQKLQFEQELREKLHSSTQEKLRFYTNFSHELKTPLTLIQGPVDDLIKNESDPETLQYLHLIKRNTSKLLKFIGRMLEFRKVEMNKGLLNVGYHDLNILAQEESESFSHLAKDKGVMFGFYCEQDLNVWVDIEKIEIVLNNLLSNAVKFSEAGQTIKFGMFHEGDDLVIEVKDEGEGIASKEIDNIFSPFFQASNSTGAGGTGIGLALCKSFVELHGGRISVQSEKGKGTQFLVHLKKGKDHLKNKDHVRFIELQGEEQENIDSEVLTSISKTESVNDSDKLVLVVDDNKDISTYVRALLKSDYKVVTSDNGQDAFEKAKDMIPDIIVTDLMMPGVDGLQLCQMIKSEMITGHIPVVLLTAKNSNESKIKGFEVGVDDYITKPFDSELLKVRINNILNSRKLLELRYGSKELCDPSTVKSSRDAEFILLVESKVLSMIHLEQFSVPDLCKELGMSQTSLYRKIKSITGDSIQLFIRRIKIKRSTELLITEEMSVTEVAFSLDFSDLKYFRKCFKEQYEMTPSEYRNKHLVQ